jgi:hypothetical protein
MKKTYLGFSIGIATLSILLIIFLATGSWERFFYEKPEIHHGTIFITPQRTDISLDTDRTGQVSWNELLSINVPLEEGEVAIAVLNRTREEGFTEEQFVAYINTLGGERRVYLTYIVYDQSSGRYRRMWNVPTVATRPDIISLFSQDLIGDRNNCIVITGMNHRNEHTMTIFRRSPSQTDDQVFDKIAEFQIDGSIVIQETGRSLAYQQGITTGQSFNIATYGQDMTSTNILDQIEIIYSFNPSSGQYEQASASRIPGSQIEQQRLREILSGESGGFENFIYDLWYYVSPQGTIDGRQYIHFNPSAREIIFYGDETQQVFRWLSSAPTRYGLLISSQNISLNTLRRRINIELESLDSIRLQVIQDVRIRIDVVESWDGSYRRASIISPISEPEPSVRLAVNAFYDSLWGRLQFHDTGEYSINPGSAGVNGGVITGRYVFYTVDGQVLLELRPFSGNYRNENRMLYRADNHPGSPQISLSRVRLGITGIHDLFEPPVVLTLVE